MDASKVEQRIGCIDPTDRSNRATTWMRRAHRIDPIIVGITQIEFAAPQGTDLSFYVFMMRMRLVVMT
jgi:hypothetical protein